MARKAVLDSSALVSAFLTPKGTTGQLLRAAQRGAFRLYLSAEILEETAGVLQRPKITERYRPAPDAARAFCEGLAQAADLGTDLPKARAVPLDPKDDVVLATAVKAAADCLITGDRKHLLVLGAYRGIRIMPPRQFLELIGGCSGKRSPVG